ncbi:MAG TPA: SpoIIE family protein phosphatase [Pseudonocardia sp.]|nr:SpoIIE family protein phosphatase [Pseudonocardia sp.]
MSYYPVQAPGGARLGVGVVLVDVTAAERTRRELAELAAERAHTLVRYQSLVEATSAAVWIRDAAGRAVEDAPELRAITGQSRAEYLGEGFLDAVHPADRAGVAAAWHAAVAGEPAVFTHVQRLCTASGDPRWYRTRAVPVTAAGVVREWVGTESDIDDEVRARHRLDVLARATVAVNAALDPEAELTALAEAVVPEFADLCRVYLVDPTPVGEGRGPLVGRRSVTRVRPGLPPSPSGADRFVFAADHLVTRSVRIGAPVLDGDPVPPREQWRSTPEMYRWATTVGVNSMLVAPVLSRGLVIAALLFVSCADRPRYNPADEALVGELAARASTAVEHARDYQQSRRVSLALQSAMLTEPPRHPGLRIEARYVAAVEGLEVGGDWYDAFTLPDGDLAVCVGDVAGHDLPAATVMGQLRSMLRALAYDSDGTPSAVLARLDRVASRLGVTRFTTLVHGRISTAGGRATFRWANAGHPVPLLIGADGEPRLLTGGEMGVVIGIGPDADRRDEEVVLEPGATLLLYTDGLVERRQDPHDRAAFDLLELVRVGAGLDLDLFCDHLVRSSPADTGDDMVVLAVRLRS